MTSFVSFGTGDINGAFHCFGTTEEDSDKLNISASGAVKNGAPTFINQEERPSRPVAVGRSASCISNTLHSVMSSVTL